MAARTRSYPHFTYQKQTERGAVGVEISTIHKRAKKLYEKHHFKQAVGDIGEVFFELDIADYLRAKRTKAQR
jgi:hypothetical protein